MTCRWVTESRLTTFGRRVIITSAVFGLTTMGSAGVAVAASDTVGFSPAAEVVSRAPVAVSVTFREPLRSSGAELRVLSEDGDVGTGKITTSQKTLRRSLRLGAPGGKYIVEWKAVSAKGKRMTGTFTFTAARGNGEVERTSPVPSPPVATEPTARAAAVARPSAPPSGTPGWISGSDPIWTPQPTPTPAHSLGGALSAGSGHSGGPDPTVSTGLTAVPLAVGGLLVLAAGLVSLINRPRLRG